MMGWITSTGSIARITGPIASGFLLAVGGLDLVMVLVGSLVVLSIVVIVVMFDRLARSDTTS
jgi:hypothetical protein